MADELLALQIEILDHRAALPDGAEQTLVTGASRPIFARCSGAEFPMIDGLCRDADRHAVQSLPPTAAMVFRLHSPRRSF